MTSIWGGLTPLSKQAGTRWWAVILLGILFLELISGCSAETAQAEATYNAVRFKATETAKVDLTIVAKTPNASSTALATMAAIDANYAYAGQQAENQTTIAFIIVTFIIIAIMLIALALGFMYGGNLKLRTDLVQKQRAQRFSNRRP